MSKYLVKDEVTDDVYPCKDITDVEWAVEYIIGEYPTDTEENEFDELLDDLRGTPDGVESFTYPNMSITVQVK